MENEKAGWSVQSKPWRDNSDPMRREKVRFADSVERKFLGRNRKTAELNGMLAGEPRPATEVGP
jgi:hypothetical protein